MFYSTRKALVEKVFTCNTPVLFPVVCPTLNQNHLICQKCNCLHYVTVNHMLLSFLPFFFFSFFLKLFFSPFISFSLPPSGFLWREGVKRKKLNPSIEKEVNQSGAFFSFCSVRKPTLLLIPNAYNWLSKSQTLTHTNNSLTCFWIWCSFSIVS